jgi:hypothetical protein
MRHSCSATAGRRSYGENRCQRRSWQPSWPYGNCSTNSRNVRAAAVPSKPLERRHSRVMTAPGIARFVPHSSAFPSTARAGDGSAGPANTTNSARLRTNLDKRTLLFNVTVQWVVIPKTESYTSLMALRCRDVVQRCGCEVPARQICESPIFCPSLPWGQSPPPH